ncbi:type III pantothenate kinase [Burkholderia multivorans]|uniref:type III pantothenate kinase n=1 Tax=Burkholderia multivorans TaxID=87883 RepID=UPI0019CFE45F|nr:type III pantothenate kinase [Burkholderia multivorans]MBN6730231.1 type III pantothenate kinase [Burkholderia multivorans]MBN6736269.1 type III pantothenate kinase [Burkholderia multivorans]MBN7126576.1 type III pantothenate kinase [Burkholderia multivorans]MBN8164034.1 type III pantothenate kinase [Burkholderia multivorans]MBN8168567.1 type III pantothenate kinase [Burkholderia multivorans]
MSEPHLLIDAGNSRIKWALADAQRTLVRTGAFGHTRDGGADPDWADLPRPRGAWISNVAGADVGARLDALLDAHWPGLPRTTIRSRPAQCGVTNGYTTPEQLGSDRWAGLIGARAAFPDEHLLIATFGTATTLEALRADGRFTGGLIAPGWALMMRALGTHTAQLPTLTTDIASGLLADAQAQPFQVDTPRSLSAGCLYAQAGLIERAWRDLTAAWQAPVRLVLAGGAADEIARALTLPHTRHDALILSGLALIAAEASAQD